MRYFCCEERRAEAVRNNPGLNGIAFLEVRDGPHLHESVRQRRLYVHLLKPLGAAPALDRVRIDRSPRSREVKVVCAALASGLRLDPGELADVADLATVLVVDVDRPGDFSPYTLRLVPASGAVAPPEGFDPLLAAVDFSFKVLCPTDLDCRQRRACPPQVLPEPALDYLAKDYASFRAWMLDRLSLLVPGWAEQTPADLGIALVELLAYVGDYLSYQQDAAATEAYLDTARRRTSVRRHARLVDYSLHEGCNARVWVHIRVSGDKVRIPPHTQLLTAVPGLDVRLRPDSTAYQQALAHAPTVFETMQPALLYLGHNQLSFYTWGARQCCLPTGATRATLCGHHPHLKAGDLLLFVEQVGPRTGKPEDADPARRHAVRLTHVTETYDPVGGEPSATALPSPPGRLPVTDIQWAEADRLPFPLCISAETDAHEYVEDVSMALGNILLADHGRTLPKRMAGEEHSFVVPAPNPALSRVRPPAAGRCRPAQPDTPRPRFRPRLAEAPLTWAVPLEPKRLFPMPYDPALEADLEAAVAARPSRLPVPLARRLDGAGIAFAEAGLAVRGGDGEWSISDGARAVLLHREPDDRHDSLSAYALPPPATTLLQFSAQEALPAVSLQEAGSVGQGPQWRPVGDLLDSDATAREFVVEAESDGSAWLRFGDDQFGMCPNPGTVLIPTYRVGNGLSGNLGAEMLHHIVTAEPGIERVRNPLPAQGGAEPESLEGVRQTAPYAFRRQERAVTPEDYADLARRHPQVQNAAATWRWTGSWHTIFLTVDRKGGQAVDPPFEQELRDFLEPFRLAGHDLEIAAPRYVPLEVEVRVAVKPGHPRSEVQAALLERLGPSILPDGQHGLFHPDNWTFGQAVYLSQLYAEVAKVEGVAWAEVTALQRQDDALSSGLDAGKLALDRLEIAQLDNDPSFPKNGVLRLKMEGGR